MFQTSCVHHQGDYIAHAALYGMCFIYLCKQSGRLEDGLNTCMKTYHIRLHVQYSLPDDAHKMFETCRRQEKLN